jgi:transposase-like protein
MAKAYSYDLRQKVIKAIQLDGMKKTEAAQVFQLSRNTIDLWLKRQRETGDYQAKSTRPHRTGEKLSLQKSCSSPAAPTKPTDMARANADNSNLSLWVTGFEAIAGSNLTRIDFKSFSFGVNRPSLQLSPNLS